MDNIAEIDNIVENKINDLKSILKWTKYELKVLKDNRIKIIALNFESFNNTLQISIQREKRCSYIT